MSGQRHHLLHQRQRPVGRVDERVVGAARERRHAEEHVRVPQRVDVVLVERLLADAHEPGRAPSRRARRTSCPRAPARGRTAPSAAPSTSAAQPVVSVKGGASRPRRARASGLAASCARTCGLRGWGRRSGRQAAAAEPRARSPRPCGAASASQSCGRASARHASAVARRVQRRARPRAPSPPGRRRRTAAAGGAGSRSSTGVVTTGSPAARYW